MAETVKLAIVISAAFRGSGAFDKAGGGLKGLSAAFKKIRTEIALFASMMAFDFLKKGFQTFMQFEQRMAEAGSIVGASKQEIAEFSDEIRAMTKELPQTADDLGAGLYDVFSAGVTDTAEAMQTLKLAAKAAVAGLTDTATSVKAGVSTMNAFGLTMEDLNHIYDVQFLTIRKGILRYSELSGEIGKIAPSAKAAGQSMESMFGTLAFLTTKGMNAAEASTALSRAYDALTMPATLSKLREMGVAVADLSDETMRTDPVLVGLRSAMSSAAIEVTKMNQAVDLATIEFETQNRELTDLEAQYNATKASMEEFSDSMSDISLNQRKNSLEIAKVRQQADREGRELTAAELDRIDQLEEANDELAIQYDELSIAQTELAKTAKEQENAVDAAQESVENASSNLETFKTKQEEASQALEDANSQYDETLAQTGKFRPLVDIVADLNTQMAGMSEIAKAQAIAQIFPQIRARKAILSIMQDTELLNANIQEMTDTSMSAGTMQEAFATNLDTTANDMKMLTNSVEELQIAISEDLLPIVQAFMEFLKPLIEFLSENTEVIWLLVAAFVAYKLVMLAATIANTAFGVSLMATPFGWVMIAIAAIIVAIAALILWWDEISQAVYDFGTALWDYLKPIVDGIVGAFNWLMDTLGAAWDLLGNVATAISDFFGGLINAAFQWGADLIDWFIDGIWSAVSGLWDVLGDIWDGIVGWLGFDDRENDMTALRWGQDAVTFFAEGVMTASPRVGTAAEQVGTGLESGLVNADVVGGAGGVTENETKTDSHDTYEININVEKIEEGMDMTKFVSNMAKEIDRQKKLKGSVSNG